MWNTAGQNAWWGCSWWIVPPDDNDFDPYDFHFHGFGQPGHEPPPSPQINVPFPLNPDHLQAIGWDVWPNQNNQPTDEAPELVPINQNLAQENADLDIQLPAIDEVVQAKGHPDAVPTPPIAEQVLAMDDVTDDSEEELQMPPLIDDLEMAMPEFPNMQNL